jgi:WD40 repeat protein
MTDESPSGPSAYHYWAFISYSHKDKAQAKWLHRAIETYSIPAKLIEHGHTTPMGEPAPKRFHPIFRDSDDLPVASDLGEAIVGALRASRYLIVVCSPDAAQSEWVKREIKIFTELGRNDRVFAYIVDGEPNSGTERECFPQTLRQQEPLAADARQQGDGRGDAKLKLLAGMLGVGYDALKQREAQRRIRRFQWMIAAALILALAFGGLALYADQERQRAVVAEGNAVSEARTRATAEANAVNEAHARATAQAVAEEQRRVAEEQRQVAVEQRNAAVSRQLAAQAINQIDNQEISLGLLLSIEAYRHSETMAARSSLLRLIQTEPRLRYFINGHGDSVWDVAISPDGKTIASASGDGAVGLWDMATGEARRPPLTGHTGAVYSVAFSPDGRYLASGDFAGQVLLWDVTHGYSQQTLFRNDGWAYHLAFSPDSKLLAASFSSKAVQLWSLADEMLVCPAINGHSESQAFVEITFSPDSRSLVVGNEFADPSSPADQLAIWDTTTCQQQGEAINLEPASSTPPGNSLTVVSLAYSPDGKQLAIGDGDRLLVLDAATREPLRAAAVIHANYPVSSLAYSPDSRILALGMGDKTIVLLDAATGQVLGDPLIGQRHAISSVAFSADGRSLVSGGWDGAVLAWDMQNQPLSWVLAGHTDAVYDVAFSPDGKLLASAGKDQTVRLWETTAWQMIGQPLAGSGGAILALAFSPDGKLLASSGQDQLIRLWDPVSGRLLGEPLAGQKAEVTCLAFSPDGKWLAAGGNNNRLLIWEVASRTLYQELQFNALLTADPLAMDLSNSIRSVGFTPDAAILYFSRGGGITDFVDLAELQSDRGSSIRRLPWNQAFSNNDILAKLSPDGKQMALANSMDVRLYDPISFQMIGLPMFGHTDQVTGLAFTPDGRLLASSGQDAAVRLWDPATGQPVGLPLAGHTQWIAGLDISPDGRWLASAGGDATVRVWDLDVQAWQSLACGIVRRNLNGAEWQQYLPDEPYHATCPDQEIPADVVAITTALARDRLAEGKTEEANTLIQEWLAWALAAESASSSNSLCWFGSQDGFAAEVMPACDRAVSLASVNQVAGMRDSRGLARALVGRPSEAVEDFQAFVEWSHLVGRNGAEVSKREEWIAALNSGQNPFTTETLQTLRSQ